MNNAELITYNGLEFLVWQEKNLTFKYVEVRTVQPEDFEKIEALYFEAQYKD